MTLEWLVVVFILLWPAIVWLALRETEPKKPLPEHFKCIQNGCIYFTDTSDGVVKSRDLAKTLACNKCKRNRSFG